jgi:hypothetical protein
MSATDAPRTEIVDLLNRLAYAADAAPDAALATSYQPYFTDDAVWEMRSESATDRRTGIDEIMDGVMQRRRIGRNGPDTGVRHHITTVVVEATSDESWTATSYYLVTGADGLVRSSGRYTDHVVRIDRRCRISERVVQVGAPTPPSVTHDRAAD